MKKKFLLAITLAFVMFFNIFTGCSFTETDTQKYYNTVVAKVGDSEITKYELLSSYNSYGYQYVSYSGYTVEEAMDMVLNQLINREVIVKYITDNFSEIFGYDELEKWETSSIWKDVFNYANKNELLNYVNVIRLKQGLEEIPEDDDLDESETNSYVRKEYSSPFVYYTDTETGKIVKITNVPTTQDKSLNLTIDDFEFAYFGEASELNKRINNLAQTQYMTNLRNNNTDKKLKTDKEILNAHLEELYKSLKNTYLITKYQNLYNDNKEISMTAILEKYKEYVKIDYQRYSGESNKASYISAVQSNASDVYFHPFEDELVYVSHILIKYDKDSTDYNLKNVYKEKYENGEITLSEYDYMTSDEYLANQCKVYEMTDGVFGDDPLDMNATELFAMIDNQLSTIKDPTERLNQFIDLAYKYNQDTAMFSTEDFYTVQLDTNYNDTMVTEFADLARNLYNEKGAGSYGICITNYGAHIVYVVGTVKNKLATSASDSYLNSITIEQLYNTKLISNKYLMNTSANAGEYTEKTLLDVFAGKVKVDDYETYISTKLNDIKNDMGKNSIVIYKNRYKDFFN